jgi:hypothetical protein
MDACIDGLRCWGRNITDTSAICSDKIPNGWNESQAVFEPEWGSWNRYGERSNACSGNPNINYVPDKALMVYEFDQGGRSIWFSSDSWSMFGYYPPGEAQYADVYLEGSTQSIQILGVIYYYSTKPDGANLTVAGNKALTDAYSPAGFRIPAGSWTNIPRGTLSSGYCLPVRVFYYGNRVHHDVMIYDNPINGLSQMHYVSAGDHIGFYNSSLIYYLFPRDDAESYVASVNRNGVQFWRNFYQLLSTGISYIGPLGNGSPARPHYSGPIMKVSTGNRTIDGLYFPRCLCGGLMFKLNATGGYEPRRFKCKGYYKDHPITGDLQGNVYNVTGGSKVDISYPFTSSPTTSSPTPKPTAVPAANAPTTGVAPTNASPATPPTTACAAATVGSAGCRCTGGGACDPGLKCDANSVCQSPDVCVGSVGAKNCACTGGGSCDANLACQNKVCLELTQPPSIKDVSSAFPSFAGFYFYMLVLWGLLYAI